jgi:Ser/Thr protein kinase RdoA (MazF antagonist)
MPIPNKVLNSAAALFNIRDTSIEPLHGGHFSHVYGFNQDSTSFVLRVTPPNPEINNIQMLNILEWMGYLAGNGASVSRPILSKENNLLEEINYNGQTYLAAVFEAADGILSEEMPLPDWNDELYRALGRTVGKIHALSAQNMRDGAARIRPKWDLIPNNFNPGNVQDADLSLILSEREKVVSYLRSLPKDVDSFGLIHGDLHMGTFFIDIQVDFDDCVYGWFMMDIATLIFDYPVVYPPSGENDSVENFIIHLLEGYVSEKPTGKFWINQLPYFLKLLEIGIYLQVYRSHDVQDSESWIGKYMPGRKERIERGELYLDIDFIQITG